MVKCVYWGPNMLEIGMRQINIILESYSLLICFILFVYQMTNSGAKTKSDKWFSAMLVFNMLMIVGDLGDWVLGGVPGKLSFYAQYFINIIMYFSSSGLLLLSLFGWIITNIKEKTTVSDIWLRVGKLFAIGQVILAVTMPIHKIAYIDPVTNYYQRGDFFFLTQICPFAVYFMDVYMLIRHRKAFSKKEFLYLGIFVTIPAIAEIIQVATYIVTALNVSISLGLIMVFTFIHSQREFSNERKIKEIMINENRKLEELQELQENLSEQLIEVLCSAVEAKDKYTRGHSMRVARYAREIMRRFGCDEKAQTEAYYIGILHDVGKIRVDDRIINKDGKLTDEEYEKIKLHTVAGYQILRGVDVIPDLAVGARWHHERYDGTGYPNGLAGEDIPLVARVISVADAYDAMTSNRSYHKVMSQDIVREQISKGMGRQFDPKIAKIMLDMMDEDMQFEMKQSDYNRTVNILVVDDDDIVHKLVEHALIDENYILTSALSGHEAIDYLKEAEFDVCLLDMEMPDMNGFEVLDWIRHNTRKLKVIFITGDKSMPTIKKSEDYGVRDYVTKPINPSILRESINSVLMH